ncbi:2OG-Fe(II) oxygenase [Sphingorhabdus lutea]|uniref:2OG-Fe(II) oxygenase n=1 Tax=Sphingorhabdus lutea TaxID=1913578 RepID=A0A1L3J8W4_9SPHN|nr:2OG-Fe(II) oxygenase [Sphingorhabdus lutea]APG61567.1 2OG-Fe(II) oxygenase [Sphingorhabdus lutea]
MTIMLEQARNIIRPTREAMLQRAPSVHHFWNENKMMFKEAWAEWEDNDGHEGIMLDSTLYAPEMRHAVEQSWEDPAKEISVKDLWHEIFPNVYKAQFFDPKKLHILRNYLQLAANADIPIRPPYGIVLNRGGAMLDPRSEGYLAAPIFQSFYQQLMDYYMRPISRLLFPDIYGYDSQTFGFSIQWQAGKDVDLRAHSDASSVTLNINLNLPGEKYSGSAVRFMDPKSRRVESLSFEPGTALIHHGKVPHASEPITEGERHNFVLWLYGEHGQTPYQHGEESDRVSAQKRWTLPQISPQNYAPF